MRTRSSLDRLAAAGRQLRTQADTFVDAAEEDRILEEILASPRPSRRRAVPRPRAALILVGAVIAVAAIAAFASGVFTSSRSAAPATSNHHRVALSGVRIEMAGYHFRTPAGFKASKTSCDAGSSSSGPDAISKPGPVTVTNGFQTAASADGGCVEVFFEIPGSSGAPAPVPPDAAAVDVGAYQGYFDSQGSSGDVLYVRLPKTADEASANPVYLVLYAHGLTEDQLIAVAQSGLPGSP